MWPCRAGRRTRPAGPARPAPPTGSRRTRARTRTRARRGRSARTTGSYGGARLGERRLAQLAAGRTVAELLALALAVAGPGDIAQVGLELERVAVLLGVAR